MGSLTLTLTTLALAAVPPLPPPPEASAPDAAQVRRAIERGLGHLDKAGQEWLTGRKCIGCHHGAFMVWSHHEARQRGFAIDEKKLADMNRQVMSVYLTDRADFEKKKGGQVRSTEVILAQVGVIPADETTAEMVREARSILLRAQQPDGSWKYAGQPQERPPAEADEITTMWAVLALASQTDSDEALAAARARARAWLEKHQTGKGNEALVLRLLLEQKFGGAARAKELLAELVSRQNADGGWSWSATRKSDPFATGESLYALGLLGHTGDDPAVQKAWKYLLAAQKPDGSWFAPTKKDNGQSAIASYWGSAWAVMGLVRTLPPEAK